MKEGKRLIKQSTLQDIINQRTLVEGLRRDVAAAEEALGKLEASTLYQLEKGASVEVGALTAERGASRRLVIAWKEVCAHELGAEFVEKTMATTTQRVTPRLIVRLTARE